MLQVMGRAHGAFRRPQHAGPTRHLLLANCDPTKQQAIMDVFAKWGPVEISPAHGDEGVPKSHCFVSLAGVETAAAALAALNGASMPALGGQGPLVVSYAERKDEGQQTVQQQAGEPPLVAVRTAEECGIPGLVFYPDFVSEAEERALLALADAQEHWQTLARRRVLHFGHVFDYEVSYLQPAACPGSGDPAGRSRGV